MVNGFAAAVAAVSILGLSTAVATETAQAAAVEVLGGELAKTCAQTAKAVSLGLVPDPQDIAGCTLAIASEHLSDRDTAGTYVNRGILYLGRAAWKDAWRDFDTGLKLQPLMAEAFVNRGAASIGLKRYKDAIADINHGLILNPQEPEKAYFNRANAEEKLNDMKSAYFDYLKAQELNPAWEEPAKQLVRFTVTRPSGPPLSTLYSK
jgi:tetratricopeptide (TPR) repeat protein